MNLRLQSLFPISLLPWCILCLHYLLHGSMYTILLGHIGTHALVIHHYPVLEMNMIDLNRWLHVQRLVLWITMAYRNEYAGGIWILLLCLNFKMVKWNRCTSESIHLTCVLCFCSTAGYLQFLLAMVCLAIYHKMKEPILVWESKTKIKEYFLYRMAYNYVFALLEWSVSSMNTSSIVSMIGSCIIFNAMVYYSVENETEEWYIPKVVPEDYPLPLNIKDAKTRCNTAKKVFKSNEMI